MLLKKCHLPISSQCVKALVYYDVQSCRLDIGNDKGDTPLHIAARWGYQGIIETLLQNGAPTEIQNRLKETALKCALNPKVALFMSVQHVTVNNQCPETGFKGQMCLRV